ncbi:MAG: aminotransferase class III-fold pyridoxal phosphate-dependent enzyme [Streptosporangiales bacterium]|nr:aminotransferase class III-fold pyridoxal phosphate-dependent enzyme [Streptosporangiales bacterium]
MSALRLARAATGRGKIAKFEGGWHGGQDFLLHSYTQLGGTADRPAAVADSAGVPPEVTGTVVTLPFNSDRAAEIIREHAEDLACVIVEPVLGGGGALPAERRFLQAVGDACRECGVVLIADEVITGFRLAPGGAAGLLGVRPDLTVFGKIVGGGLPVGAVCGRGDLVDRVLAGDDGLSVVAGGTHAANPMTTAAGVAQLDVLLENPEIYSTLEARGDRLRSELSALVSRLGISAHVTGAGSLWGFHFTDAKPANVRDLHGSDKVAARMLAALLLREGVFLSSPVHLAFLSSAHGESELDQIVAAHATALERMKTEGIV